jgi:dihydrolipoamide dehydrogenase
METERVDVAVVGAGPGGYAAAFRAADLGLRVVMVDDGPKPGGVCLFRGCIPSKALLNVANVIDEARGAKDFGVEFGEPNIDLAKMRSFKDGVIQKLTGGLGELSKRRKIRYVRGRASVADPHTLEVDTHEGPNETIACENVILATGSRPARPKGLWIDSPRVMDSTGALDLERVPSTLLVVGGGYIGLELGSVYASLGSRVSVVEMTAGLLPGVDRDLVRVLQRRLGSSFESILLETQVSSVEEAADGIHVRVSDKDGENKELVFDKVLVSVGRQPNGAVPGLEKTKVKVDGRGFIVADRQRRTAEPSIFAIGDVAGEPMLAHKASAEGKIAAEVIVGENGAAFDPRAIPAVVFTEPEIAWCGLTESEASAKGIAFQVARFPWEASGRALSMGHGRGLTKLLIDPESERILGAGFVGAGAGELVSESVLAIEMGATANDLALSMHPHPTLSETVMEAAEAFFGQATHIYRPKR